MKEVKCKSDDNSSKNCTDGVKRAKQSIIKPFFMKFIMQNTYIMNVSPHTSEQKSNSDSIHSIPNDCEDIFYGSRCSDHKNSCRVIESISERTKEHLPFFGNKTFACEEVGDDVTGECDEESKGPEESIPLLFVDFGDDCLEGTIGSHDDDVESGHEDDFFLCWIHAFLNRGILLI